MTPAGIEPATFRFVAQHLSHCAAAVPRVLYYSLYILVLYEGMWPLSLQCVWVWFTIVLPVPPMPTFH